MSTPTPYLRLTKPDAIENYSLAVFNNNSDTLDEAIAKLPRGPVKVGSRSSTSGAMTATNLDAVNPITLQAGRMYKFTMNSVEMTSDNTSSFQIQLNKAPTTDTADATSNLSPLGLKNSIQVRAAVAGVPFSNTLMSIIRQTVDETFQMKITYSRVQGTGTIQCVMMNWILEDIGQLI